MESIVLASDIARLVFSYLLNNDLKRAALAFSRTSTHLNHEFVALRQGLQPHNFLNGGLEDMIREHVKITSIVANAVHKLPANARQRLEELKLSDRVSALLKLDKSKSSTINKTNANSNLQRKRRSTRGTTAEDLDSSSDPIESKRARLLVPHLYCSIKRSSCDVSDQVDESESLNSSSSSSTDISSSNTDDALALGVKGPKNNSTPRTTTSDEPAPMMLTPQTMPELTQAIMTNGEFQEKLLSNINVALQSITVHTPAAEAVDSEAVLDTLVRNILEATEKDPSFDRIIEEVVGKEAPLEVPEQAVPEVPVGAQLEPAPPQTPLIIRSAMASVTGGINNAGDGGNANCNAEININANTSLSSLIDPNFRLSKLIVLNSNESAQKQHSLPLANLSFGSDNLMHFGGVGGGECGATSDIPSAAANYGAGQVCVDASNGQLTFPLFLSNEGMLSQLPFLVNNEWLAQQLRSDVFANTDVSHIEIPLPEPITVTADQLPPNSIIINSAVKQPPIPVDAPSVEPPAQLIADQQPTIIPVTTAAADVTATSLPDHSGGKVPASLDSSRLVVERVTPSTSGIVNVKAFRSLSTPRKRTSHVRTLNFSPKAAAASIQSTPVSTRRLQQLSQRRMQLGALKEKEEQSSTQLDKATVNGSSPAAVRFAAAAAAAVSADGSGNESNSCVPPLFAMEESSNQTVIKAVITKQPSKQQSPAIAFTPKRKQKRRAAVKACKRINSIATTLVENIPDSANKQQALPHKDSLTSSSHQSLDDSKENQRMPMQERLKLPEAKAQQEDLMAAWQRQMHGTSTDLEQRLRDINAKREEQLKNATPVRRNRPVADSKTKSKQKKLKSPQFRVTKRKRKQMSKEQQQHLQHQLCSGEGEFSIKLTPVKKLPMKRSPELGQKSELQKDTKETDEHIEKEISAYKAKQQQQKTQSVAETLKPEIIKPTVNSMAEMLQETPLKLPPTGDADADDIPPTPGPTLMPPPETPYSQLLLPSVSSLFGSDTKSILDTPMLMAITPGVHLTPFAQSLNTPHSSGARTDYSSGSSYYRPDEAEHMDTNAQCALQPTPLKEVQAVMEPTARPSTANNSIGLHAERVPVEPTVLRRVRSFGSEAVDSVEGAVALAEKAEQPIETPHYKLMSGLPDAVLDSNSNSSSSTSSSTTTSSSSSSSSSASSSSNSSDSSSPHTNQVPDGIKPLLDIQNLSDISSTEDEEWLKAAAAGGSLDVPPLTIDSEPTQLVSQDGEVRYPLRNWLTPSKDATASANVSGGAESSVEMKPPAVPVATTSSKTTMSPKPTETNPTNPKLEAMEQRIQNLAMVRERVKAKCKQETTSKTRPKKTATSKKLTAMRGTAHPPSNQATISANKASLVIQPKKTLTPVKTEPTAATACESVKSKPVLNNSSKALLEPPSSSSSELDPALLIALNLSAKKQQQPAARVAVEIAAKPATTTTGGQRRGRPKKSTNPETAPAATRVCTRRSSRLIEHKTPATATEEPPLQASRIETASKLVKAHTTTTTTKVTKKPAKKRAEARLETAAPTLTTLAEVKTEQKPQEKPNTSAPSLPSLSLSNTSCKEYEWDMSLSASQSGNTIGFTYFNNGNKPSKPIQRPSSDYFKNFQMRIMVDSEVHTMRITSSELLHQSLPSAEDNANVTSNIRNIPKKRIIEFNNTNQSKDESAGQTKPMASSTPVATKSQNEKRNNNDQEVASTNTSSKSNASEEQHEAGVQFDIESILSHLHGT